MRAVIPLTTVIDLLDRVPQRYRALVLLATFASLRFGELFPEIAPKSRWHLEQFAQPAAGPAHR